MRREELRYELPAELIAQRPAEPRDASRLLVLHRETGRIEHRTFCDIGAYLRAGDCLVLNNTRVIPARFFCRRETGGRIEAFFLRVADDGWRVLLKPASRLRVGERLSIDGAQQHELHIVARHERGEWTVTPSPRVDAIPLLERIGQTPLPPYIQREAPPDAADRERYQTVYAKSAGAVAAPTAGLHFTPALLANLADSGVRSTEVTLHVGLGTFAPIDVEDLRAHRMHSEWYDVPSEALATLRNVRESRGRVIGVGTTAARVLESLSSLDGPGASGWTSIFIHPPYRFRHVEALLTNFHLPESTLLALVMAFAGIEPTRAAYAAAIENRYRFYSYGDAMLIL